MSRRASLFAKENPGSKRPQVSFPDELVFLDNIKENDMEATYNMLRRASVTIDINALGDAGMTPLHQAVLDGNLTAVRLLLRHGADVNKIDDDSWSPLHAACAEGHSEICSYLLEKGADKSILTEDGERPLDLVDPQDFATVAVMLSHGRNSPPPNFRNHHRDDDDDDDDEDDEEDEEEYDDEGDDFEETKSPIAVSLPPPPLRSCLKSARKLTIRDDVIAESVDL